MHDLQRKTSDTLAQTGTCCDQPECKGDRPETVDNIQSHSHGTLAQTSTRGNRPGCTGDQAGSIDDLERQPSDMLTQTSTRGDRPGCTGDQAGSIDDLERQPSHMLTRTSTRGNRPGGRQGLLPHVLYITHRVPYPPDKGDRIRNFNVLRQLVRHARVTLATLDDEGLTLDFLAQFGDRIINRWIGSRRASPWRLAGALATGRSLSATAFHNPALCNWLADARHEPFDAAMVSASSLAQYLRLPGLRNVPGIIDLVDVDSQKWFDFAAAVRGPRRWLYQIEGRRLRRLERELAGWAAGLVLVSDAEKELFHSIVGRTCAITATNGVDLDYFQPCSGQPQQMVMFLGAMDYFPNVDACAWFVDQVWPRVRARFPQAHFRVVGRNPSAAVRELKRFPRVEVTGSVADVRPHLAEAAALAAPLRLGRGLQNKVLEAMACAKAVIASPLATNALRTRPGRDLLQADSPESWADAITALFLQDDLRLALGQNARRYVEEHHDWQACLQPLIDRVLAACRREVAA